MEEKLKQELFELISQTPGIVAFGIIEDPSFSKINKSTHKRKLGHRQPYTRVEITKIVG